MGSCQRVHEKEPKCVDEHTTNTKKRRYCYKRKSLIVKLRLDLGNISDRDDLKCGDFSWRH